MNRRDFSKLVSGAALGSAVLPALSSPAAAYASMAEPSFKLSVMLWTVYRDLPFTQRLEKVAAAGYHAVELVGEFEKWTPADYKTNMAKMRELNMVVDCTAGMHTGIANPATQKEFLTELDGFAKVTEQIGTNSIIMLSGNRVEGLSQEAHHKACIEALKRAADIAERRNWTLLLENIDGEENPKYYLTSVAEGFEITRAVGSPRVKFLYDFYHEQISEGNLIEKMEKNIDQCGLFHIADVPGRNEPGTGEINYASIFRKMQQLKYKGYVAMEFIPTADPIASLKAAREFAIRSAQA